MSMLFQFHEMDSVISLTRLAQIFQTTYHNNSIMIEEPIGKGSISYAQLEEGLHLRIWDFNLHNTFTFQKTPGTAFGEKIFHIAYLLNPEALKVKVSGMEQPIQVRADMNVLFVSNDIEIEVEIDTIQGLQALDISLSASWLQQSFAEEAANDTSFIYHILQSKEPVVFFEPTSSLEYRLLSKVHQSLIPGIKNLFRLKAGAFSLLSDFFSKAHDHPLQRPAAVRHAHYEKMVLVEQLLYAHLQKKLPPMETIARQNALSESNLKRSFKEIFGKSIYDYYLGLKMDAAKRTLLMGNSTVNEIALQFNYEKTSSFIDMFKRHHGISPGSLKKNGLDS